MNGFQELFPVTWAVVRAITCRKARRVWLVLSIAIVVGLASIHTRAWIFRWQARRMLNDLRALEMTKSVASDALKLRQKWPGLPRFLATDDVNARPCTAEKCDFHIGVSEWDLLAGRYFVWEDAGWRAPLNLAVRALEHFGMRMSQVIGEVRIRHGVVVAVGATVITESRWGHGFPFALVASATPVPNLWLYSVPDEHPNLHVKFQGPPDHGGCEPCRMTKAAYTTQISRDEFRKVTDFDLSCLTSFRRCGEFGDMMPQVKRMVLREEAQEEHRRRSGILPPCTLRTIETLGRDWGDIAVMRVKRVHEGRPASMQTFDGDPMPDAGEQRVDYDLVEKLKWRSNKPLTTSVVHQLWFSGEMIDPETHLLSREWFRPGESLIVFFDPLYTQCGAVPASAANLSAVRAGIAEDRRDDWN